MCYILSLLERDWESESGAAELLYAHLTPSGRQITNLLHRCHVAIREARARGVGESPACVGWAAQNVNGTAAAGAVAAAAFDAAVDGAIADHCDASVDAAVDSAVDAAVDAARTVPRDEIVLDSVIITCH